MTKVTRFGFPLQLKGKTILAMVLVGLLPLVLSLLLTYFEEKRGSRQRLVNVRSMPRLTARSATVRESSTRATQTPCVLI